MTRNTIKDWSVESLFRDLQLRGIDIKGNAWLESKYRDFQEKEDSGLRAMPLFPDQLPRKKKVIMFDDFEYIRDPSQEGPTCSMLEALIRQSTADIEFDDKKEEIE